MLNSEKIFCGSEFLRMALASTWYIDIRENQEIYLKILWI
jgi:hypothetical protein